MLQSESGSNKLFYSCYFYYIYAVSDNKQMRYALWQGVNKPL